MLTEALGSELLAHVELPGKPVVTEDVLEGAVEMEDAMLDDLAQQAEEQRTTFVGRFGAESDVRPDHVIDVAVDTSKLHFFDLETGISIRTAD